jgi:hypothetical protein
MRKSSKLAVILAALSSALLVRAAPEPLLYRATLRVEPSDLQLQTLPAFPALWVLSRETAADLPAWLAQKKISPTLAAELARRRQPTDDPSVIVLVPDRALLDRFTPDERAAWHELLCRHPGNDTYRWPLSLSQDDLDRLAAETRWQEAVSRLRRFGVNSGDRLFFGDLFALEDAFASPFDRREFYRLTLGGLVQVPKLRRSQGQRTIADQAAWWQINGRYRAIEPMLNAVSALPNGPRLDLAHILPRLPRSLLNTFPPDLTEANDVGIESSVMASDFFSLAPGADPRTEGTFAEWLSREAVPATGPHQYGDLLIYGNPSTEPWPYTVVYVAGNIGFTRRPTAYGPWQFIELDDIGRLNPRFAGKVPQAFRSKTALINPERPPFIPGKLPSAWRQQLRLKEVKPGPWGRLRYYDVLLAPAGDILEQLTAPDPHPRWSFQGISRENLLSAAEATPTDVRERLQALFRTAQADSTGQITVEPSLDLVLAVPSEFRSTVFPYLVGGLSIRDYVQHIPFPKGFTIDEWFEAGTLPESVRQAILRLIYPSGDRVMLSDFGALYQLLDTRLEQLSAHRAALRMPAMVVLLERPAPADVPALAAYWSYGRDKNVRHFLESFAADPNQQYLDIIHLLSPVERELINTYFTPAGTEAVPSCFWTAFNFGAERPDDRFLVIPGVWTEHRELAFKELAEKYEAISAPNRLGDVIAYRRKGASAYEHVCVFLADDLVFTKNGFTFSAPWRITRLGEIDTEYLSSPEMERCYFRRRAPGR